MFSLFLPTILQMVVMLIRKQLVIWPFWSSRVLLLVQFFDIRVPARCNPCSILYLIMAAFGPTPVHFLVVQSACSVFCFCSWRVFWLTRRDICGILSLWLSAIRVRWNVAIRSWTYWLPPIKVPKGSLWSGRFSLIWRISSAFDLVKKLQVSC